MRRRIVAVALATLALMLALPFGPLRITSAAAGTIAKVQTGAEATSTTGNLTVTLSSASTTGDLLVAMVSNGGTTSLPFSGPTGWVNATGLWQASNGRTEIWYYANNPGGITSAAFTSSSSSIGATGQMSEFSGAAASGVLDKTGTATVTSSTSATVSTSAATTLNGDLGITAWGTTLSETSYTAGSGWTHLLSDGTRGAGVDYQLGLPVATASETETASSSSAGWVFMIATFKPVQVPGAVGGLTATADSNQATISWTAPTSGGAPTYYVVTALSGGTTARNTTATASTSVTMTGLTASVAYKFSVYGVNAAGNGTSSTTSSSVTPIGSADPYTSGVLADSPTFYYRLDETAGTTALDSTGNGATATEVGGPTQGSASTLSTDTDGAAAFNGSSQYAYSNSSYVNPTTFSIEAWFKTTTTVGGKIVGFGTSQTGSSGSFDRQIWMSNSGQLYFGVYTGAIKTINSASSYNDGNLHHVVATLSSAGMFLYIDGSQAASDATTTTAQNYTGYWRIGYDNLANWGTGTPTSYYFNGTIDEVAVYPTALSLARVQVHHCEGSNSGCSVPGAVSALTASAGANQATVSWTAPSSGGPVDRYVITALSGGTASRNTTATASTSVTLTGLAGSTAYKFSVYAANAGGNGSTVTTASTVTPTGTANTYTAAVLSDSPTFYYRLDETAGTTALDSSGNAVTSTEVSNPTHSATGVLTSDTDGATQFDGATDYMYSNTSYVNPTTFTIEAWFQTSTTSGGRIVGFGTAQTGASGSFDRQIYMSNTGQLYFGVYPGAVKTINSTASYNDGNKHHVVATLSSAGMFLYVDGGQVASDATTTTAQSYTGYWRVGYDNLSGWTAAPTSHYFNGTIDEVAVYSTALSLQRTQVHYCDGSNNSCLSMTGPTTVTFASQTLDGLDHTKTVTATFDVTDNTGGDGWNITATSTSFTAGTHSLATTATSVQSAPTDTCDSGWTCSLVTNSTSYPYTLPAGATAPTATKLVDAALGTGAGHQTITVTFTLSVPANAYSGSYASTFTFALVSGP